MTEKSFNGRALRCWPAFNAPSVPSKVDQALVRPSLRNRSPHRCCKRVERGRPHAVGELAGWCVCYALR